MHTVGPFLLGVIYLSYVALLGFLIWRFYRMTQDVAEIRQLLVALAGTQMNKGAAPSPEPRPVSDPSEPA